MASERDDVRSGHAGSNGSSRPKDLGMTIISGIFTPSDSLISQMDITPLVKPVVMLRCRLLPDRERQAEKERETNKAYRKSRN